MAPADGSDLSALVAPPYDVIDDDAPSTSAGSTG
jgi:hypothetical protein